MSRPQLRCEDEAGYAFWLSALKNALDVDACELLKSTASKASVNTLLSFTGNQVTSLVILEGREGESLVIGGSSLVILEGKACNPL